MHLEELQPLVHKIRSHHVLYNRKLFRLIDCSCSNIEKCRGIITLQKSGMTCALMVPFSI
jgi:hypothetical protein